MITYYEHIQYNSYYGIEYEYNVLYGWSIRFDQQQPLRFCHIYTAISYTWTYIAMKLATW